MNASDIDTLDKMLRDIRLEALTATRNLETEDPLRSSLTYISEVSTSAMSLIEKQ